MLVRSVRMRLVGGTSALGASSCVSVELPDDAPAPTPGIYVARWTHAARGKGAASIRALYSPTHAAAATNRQLAFEIEHAEV